MEVRAKTTQPKCCIARVQLLFAYLYHTSRY